MALHSPSVQENQMARKSRELRLSQSRELFAAYTEAGLADDFRYSFIRDMISRLERNRGTSTKQRNWIDSLIEEGVPAPKGDPVLLARIEAAQAVVGMKEYDINILGEFAGKIRRGWDLSEKQAAWMEKLIAEADRLAVDGPYTPDALTLEKFVRQCSPSRHTSKVILLSMNGPLTSFSSRWAESFGNSSRLRTSPPKSPATLSRVLTPRLVGTNGDSARLWVPPLSTSVERSSIPYSPRLANLRWQIVITSLSVSRSSKGAK